MNTFIYLYDELSFSSDLIAYLVEYCVSKNHTAIRYIEATALKWAESGIRTVTVSQTGGKDPQSGLLCGDALLWHYRKKSGSIRDRLY